LFAIEKETILLVTVVAEAPYVESDGDRIVIHTFVSFDFGPDGYTFTAKPARDIINHG
jgi:hypothetical protein